MLEGVGGRHHHVIHVHNNALVDEVLEYLVHKSLVCYSNVLEAEVHDLVIIVCLHHDESDLQLISLSHGNLIIYRVGFQNAQHVIADNSIY